MDRRTVIYGSVRQTDRHTKGETVGGLRQAYVQRLIRTLRQSKEFQQHESVSYGVCPFENISDASMCVCVRVYTLVCARVRKPTKNAAVITLTAAQ